MKSLHYYTYPILIILLIILIPIRINSQIVKKEKKNITITQKSTIVTEKKIIKKDKPVTKVESEEKKAENIEKTIDYGIQEDRKAAINKILTIKDTALKNRLTKKLIALLKTELDPEILEKTIIVIGEVNATEAVPDIVPKIDDTSDNVQVAAVYAIKKLKGISAKNKLIEKLKSQDLSKNTLLTEALINTLAEFNAIEIINFAIESIKSNKTNLAVREFLVLFLGKLNSKEPKDFLIKIYKDDEEEVMLRCYAVNSLAKLGITEAAKDIKEVIKAIETYPFKKRKKYFNLNMYSLAALAKLGDSEVIPLLTNALRSNNASIRLKAVLLLKELKDKRTIDILKYKMENDPNEKVQKAATEALKELGVPVQEKKEKASPVKIKKSSKSAPLKNNKKTEKK